MSNQMRFEDKVAIVTGGAGGIGGETVKALASEGAKVVIADFADSAQEFSDQLNRDGLDTYFVKTDVTNEENVKNLVTATVKKYGKVDLLVANAGIGLDGPIHELSYADWKKTIGINLDGVFLSDKYVIEQMRKQETGGAIVNTGSIHGLAGKEGIIAYGASKGGVKLLTQSLGATYAKEGIRVNSINPGYIDTPLLQQLPEEIYNELVKLHPIGRLGKPEEVAKGILFLLSDDASFIVGSNLLMDGGYTAV